MEGFSFVTRVTGLNRPNTGNEDDDHDHDHDHEANNRCLQSETYKSR
jgi:hypothetical protein